MLGPFATDVPTHAFGQIDASNTTKAAADELQRASFVVEHATHFAARPPPMRGSIIRVITGNTPCARNADTSGGKTSGHCPFANGVRGHC